MQYISVLENDTFGFAKSYAQKLQGGEVIGLIGNLGAGKTVFAQGLAAGLKVKGKVTSPTFVLMKIYKAKHNKISQFCHIDAYRIKNADDLNAIGAKEYFAQTDTITLIEWADKAKALLPKNTKFINIKIINNQRLIKY